MLLTDIIDSIRGLLDDRASSVSPEVLALEYAKECRAINERLAKIGLMLEGGGEIQALQFAEQPPRVVDAALALSFGGESGWQEYCRNHGHEVAALIDARTLELLLEFQSKGLASNHPLYKEYRAAVSSRDDARAHDLIRVIARMNPGDENAVKELKRLQRKSLQSALASLKANLNAGDDLLMAAMSKVEEAGIPEDYEGAAEWKQASVTRNSLRRSKARQRMPETLKLAGEELANGEWRQAAVWQEEYKRLAEAYGHDDKTASLDDSSKEIERKLGEHRAEAERVAQARRLVVEMEGIADEVETRMVTPMGLSAEFAGPLVEELTRKIRKHESLRGEFPNSAKLRVEAARAQLVQAMERSNRSKRLRLVSVVSVAAVVLLTAAGAGVLVFRASGHADLLQDLRSKQATSGARDLVTRIKADEPLLLKFPRLSTEWAQTNQWIEEMDAKRVLVARELETMEGFRREEFAAVSSRDLFSRLNELGSLVSDLPPDLGTQPSTRLTVLRNESERVLMMRQETADLQARELAASWSGKLAQLQLDGPASAVGEILEPAKEELAPFLGMASGEAPMLRLPASTESMVSDVDARVRAMMEKVGAVSHALKELKAAETSEAYREAVTRLADCSFSESIAAQRVIDAWPDDDRLRALLVFRGNLVALKMAENDSMTSVPIPETAVALDRDVVSELTSSARLNDLWDVEWEDRDGKKQSCFSKGQLVGNPTNGWKGELASYPRFASSTLKFVERTIDPYNRDRLISNTPTGTAEMMARLDLKNLLDDTGTKFRSSVLPLLDMVGNNKKVPPLAKAYVLGQLFRLIQNHQENEWGLYYCPSLIDDIKKIEELRLKEALLEGSWLVDQAPEIVAPYQKYFSNRGEFSTFNEMREARAAARAAIANPVELAGHVGADGSTILVPDSNRRLVLAVCDIGDGILSLKVCGIVEPRDSSLSEDLLAAPFSPILSIRLPDESQEFLWSIHKKEKLTINPDALKP